jgi:hypothetical protein
MKRIVLAGVLALSLLALSRSQASANWGASPGWISFNVGATLSWSGGYWGCNYGPWCGPGGAPMPGSVPGAMFQGWNGGYAGPIPGGFDGFGGYGYDGYGYPPPGYPVGAPAGHPPAPPAPPSGPGAPPPPSGPGAPPPPNGPGAPPAKTAGIPAPIGGVGLQAYYPVSAHGY